MHSGRFKERLVRGGPLLGTFQKSASYANVEILGSMGFDFLVIDQEHAPLGREAVDALLLAARARQIPALVRVSHPGEIGHALDSGADGIIAPHVRSANEAREVVAACRYAGGRRGYSNSSRAAGYGAVAMAEHVRAQDAAAVVVVMLEDTDAVTHADAILAVEGVDAMLLGCADLAVSLGEPAPDTPKVREVVQRLSRSATRRVLAAAPSIEAAAWLFELGIDGLVIGSDQGFLRAGAAAAHREFRGRT